MPTLNKVSPATQAVIEADGISVSTPVAQPDVNEVKVRVFLPLLEDDSAGVTVDQTVEVIINGNAKTTYVIMRGEYVDVPVPVFIQLKNRFPHI